MTARRVRWDSYWPLRALGLAALLGAGGLVPSGLAWCVEVAIRVAGR